MTLYPYIAAVARRQYPDPVLAVILPRYRWKSFYERPVTAAGFRRLGRRKPENQLGNRALAIFT
jgi:hypothetical protein